MNYGYQKYCFFVTSFSLKAWRNFSKIKIFTKLLFISFCFFKFLFKYSCLHFPVTLSPTPPNPTSHPQSFSPSALSMGPLYMFLDDLSLSFPHYLFPLSPLITVSLFFISMSLVLFCLLVLLIKFHLSVRSYGICPSPPGLFHLAQCSPAPSMLLERVGAPSFFLLPTIPLCKCTSVFWSTHLLMGT